MPSIIIFTNNIILIAVTRMKTVTNVMGDSYGAGMINHLSTDLPELPDNETNGNANGHTIGTGIEKSTSL